MKTKSSDHRFTDDIAQEYELITLAYPDFEVFLQRMVEGIDFSGRYPEATAGDDATRDPFHLLEIGTGDGFTTVKLMDAMNRAGTRGRITGIDIDAGMIEKAEEFLKEQIGRHRVHFQAVDALAYLQDCPDAHFDVVASSFTLHNFENVYRKEVERQIHRVLRSGGLFTNADKYAPSGQDQFDALAHHVDQFFSAFVPRGKIDLLRKWVIHNISDQSPRHVMFADETIAHLEILGFRKVRIEHRAYLQAVLGAIKG